MTVLKLDNGSVTTLVSTTPVEFIEQRIAPLRARLASHPLYARIRTAEDIRKFMQFHVFAVWDFMSLLKALQGRLTCVAVPWRPTRWPESRRFINEIVLGEESDHFEGRAISHFELYLEAMEQCGANTAEIRNLLKQVEAGAPMESAAVPDGVREFLRVTFSVIEEDSPSALAAAFTFGREDLIPDMFRELVRSLNGGGYANFSKFVWYLERHIAVDGDEHGPLSLQMVTDICGTDEARWEEAAAAAERAITARLALWDAIVSELRAG